MDTKSSIMGDDQPSKMSRIGKGTADFSPKDIEKMVDNKCELAFFINNGHWSVGSDVASAHNCQEDTTIDFYNDFSLDDYNEDYTVSDMIKDHLYNVEVIN